MDEDGDAQIGVTLIDNRLVAAEDDHGDRRERIVQKPADQNDGATLQMGHQQGLPDPLPIAAAGILIDDRKQRDIQADQLQED